MTDEPEFKALLWRRAMRRLGLEGKSALVRLERDAISLRGEKSGELRIPFAQIARVRVGFSETRSGVVHELMLWRAGEPKPVGLFPGADRARYGTFVRSMAAALLGAQPPVRVETGSGNFVPIVIFGCFGSLIIASVGFAIYLAAIGDDWWTPLGALGVSALLLAILGPWTLSRYRPRPIASAGEIERAIPGC